MEAHEGTSTQIIDNNTILPNNNENPPAERKPSPLAILSTMGKEMNMRLANLSVQHEGAISALEQKLARLSEQVPKLQQTVAKLKNENLALKQAQSSPSDATSTGQKGVSDEPADNDAEFKSVYETFKCQKCADLSKRCVELAASQASLAQACAKLQLLIESAKASIRNNEGMIEGVWKQLRKTRDSAAVVFEQNKALKEAFTKERRTFVQSKAVALHMLCIEDEADKNKHLLIAQHIKKIISPTVLDFSDQPISDSDIVHLSQSLMKMHCSDCIKEITISKGYACNMEGLVSLIKQNSGTLSKITVNNTLLNVHVAIKILETLALEKVALEELNLDSNQLHDDDLVLLVKPFMETVIRQFSVRGNDIFSKSIEKFCKATKHVKTLECIDVGEIKLSEQKELEWKTDFKKLVFQRTVLRDIDYHYIN